MALVTTQLIPLNLNARPAAAYLASLQGAGRAGMQSELTKLARLMGADNWRAVNWASLNAANVAAMLAKVEGAPATRNHARACIRGVARAAWRLSLITSDELTRINDIPSAKGDREIAGRDIEAWEIAAIMRTCNDGTPAGARDAALIALAVKTAARRNELGSISMSDLSTTTEGYEIRVIGKGNKARNLFVDNGASKALSVWLQVRGDEAGALFVSVNKSGIIRSYDRLSVVALDKLLKRRIVGLKPLSWHDFRRTFVGELLGMGEDISTIAQLVGHSSVATTARYDRRPVEARRKASRRISVPYFGA